MLGVTRGMRDLRAGWATRAKKTAWVGAPARRKRAAWVGAPARTRTAGWGARANERLAVARSVWDQLAFALGVAAGEDVDDEADDDAALEVLLLAAAFPSPDDLLSLALLLSELSDLGVDALLPLSSELFLAPGLP